MEMAQAHPVWDLAKLSGLLIQQGTNCMLKTRTDTFKITGNKLTDIASYPDKWIVANGFMKAAGEFEISDFLDLKERTLELFVMSFCPFGQRAEEQLLNFMSSTNNPTLPQLDIHYIVYRNQKDGQDVFTSMHGDAEVAEDLVQIVMRDHFPPTLFTTYLHLRAKNGQGDWKVLAQQAGFSPDNLTFIQTTITTNRDALLRAEYDYAVGRYGITDGSPSYVWESERVSDLRRITAFKGLDEMKADTCSH